MKNPLKKIFDDTKPFFTGDGKYKKYEPIWDATKTFFFLPSQKNSFMPFVRDHLDLKRYMSIVVLSLLPVTFFGIYNTGYQAGIGAGESWPVTQCFLVGACYVLPIIIVSYAVGFAWEFLFAVIRGHNISEGFLVTGLLFPLTLPPTIPLWQVALGISFGVIIGKEVFGGTGRNILNPALTGRAFLFFSYPVSMSGDVWVAGKHLVDGVTGATALSVTGAGGQSITAALGDAGYSLGQLFTGFVPGSVGETSALCCLFGAAILMVTRIANYRVIIGGIAGLVITSVIVYLIPGGQESWSNAGPLYHLCAGGFLFGISFMATDPVSAPGTNPGRWIFGAAIGFLTVIIRVGNPAFMEGVMLAILFMNVFAPLLDHLVLKYKSSKRIPNV
ncbi:NADH:ubiquinone reductase (Na(+)-transporting) subunit B [Desulfobacter hydrogenophilus]|uniref:Na(+)-translocating NADH-quinone reductase subunit B n=1 Tax=Desulfobacter hydrogenophilus TaxID=2291 RepID=A0A328F970_9BACT|nr:NADH:ubiquinone reductase (Na(+)-transporting) subunit B [Desulfobacter hydrogenophilus]NDY73438.1 NADH:ubiquinone reductase (Na(+)-transporting) subunit B [Desulfobacter hydrogenophilus]QBH12396.1 NADH:ubiquinone reductase (Na(+)-transporting) subunit B [Desulfobacter hydrogenophilus]RAM00766.1 NADH:ubiquinone reductase (Na(+)-transporting) subunit B [Desulfobacter hydrogenophilus]